ncbi:MAG: enoyl-CoA hydratase/isomerase family protein [Chrysiogenetes bacterium]|nr:enoyl-CoA hydratase/isomerase family protein [Chrysiogenetes bacterium]
MEFIKIEKPRKHVALITLNRPERYNALSHQVVRELLEALDTVAGNLDTRVIVITGAGKGFCAGADLKEGFGNTNPNEKGALGVIQATYQMQKDYGGIPLKMRQIPQPIIAAVNGPAAGGGMAIALASDIRICTPTTKFNNAFIKIGIGGADMGSSYFLQKLLGSSVASEMMYTGRFMEPGEALQRGLVSRIVEGEKLLDAAFELAEQIIGTASPFALRITKEAINRVQGGLSLEESIEIENRNQVMALQTKDVQRAVMAWVQKKVPEYEDD